MGLAMLRGYTRGVLFRSLGRRAADGLRRSRARSDEIPEEQRRGCVATMARCRRTCMVLALARPGRTRRWSPSARVTQERRLGLTMFGRVGAGSETAREPHVGRQLQLSGYRASPMSDGSAAEQLKGTLEA